MMRGRPESLLGSCQEVISSVNLRHIGLRQIGLKQIGIAALVAVITGCNSAPTVVPAELTRIESTRSAKTVWSKGVGGGGERPAVRFAPYVTDDTVYSALSLIHI